MSKIAYVGYSRTSVPRFENYLPEPHAPSNYKDEFKIREYVTAAREKQFQTAPDMPLTGVLKDIAILTNVGKKLEPVEIPDGSTPAEVLSLFNVISAFDVSAFLRMLRIDAIDTMGSLPEELMWLAFPAEGYMYLDPIQKLLGAGDHDPFLVAQRFLNVDEHQYSEKYIGVAGKARLTADLTKLLGV